MNIKPLSFNYPMVQALKERTKTVTRRLQKPEETLLQVGDLLWVREPYTSQYSEAHQNWQPIYQADCSQWEMQQLRFRENYLMPKKYARIFLRITKVTEEFLQDITNEEAIKEGILADLSQSHPVTDVPWCFNYVIKRFLWSTPRESFLSFFEAIYGMALVTKNPRVWRYEFEYAERPNTEEFLQDFKILNITQNQFQTSNF